MKPWVMLLSSLLLVVLLAPQSGYACGEGIYAVPDGANHRGYLAPRRAAVLVYNNQETVPEATKAVYRGLARAGHKLEVARSPEQLAIALRDHRYDVVIANYEQIDVIGKQYAPASKAKLLPIMTDGQRGASSLRDRFRFSLSPDAGLIQYLKLIDRLIKDRA